MEQTETPIVAMDTETEEFNYAKGLTPRTVKMQGLSIAYDEERATYTTEPDEWEQILEDNKDSTVVFHHAKFDLLKLEMAGLPVPRKWEDTKIAATLIDENREASLKPLAKQVLGKGDTVLYKDVDRSDPVAFAQYAANDSRYTYGLWSQFRKDLKFQDLIRVYELEKAVVPVVQSMEAHGMLVDRNELKSLGEFVTQEHTKTLAKVLDLAGDFDFDPNSTKQVGNLLYDELGIDCPKYTKKGQRSTDREALSQIEHPMAEAILDYREYEKMASTYTLKWPTLIEADGCIHPEFNQLGAKPTGRFSCSNPNIQQSPSPARSELGRRLRNCFIAGPGRKLVVADYSQMELRVLAHYSEDPLLLEAYNSTGDIDLHYRTASLVFNKPESDVTKGERGIAKTANFAISYGITALGLYKRLKALGIQTTLPECVDFVAKYFKTYRGVKAFLERVERTVKRRGYVMSLYGRRRRVKGKTPREIRQAQNFIIQSSAAELCKQAMVDVHAQVPDGDFIQAMIHDELIVNCEESHAEAVRDLVIEQMSRTPDWVDFKVPIKADVHIVDRWGDAK